MLCDKQMLRLLACFVTLEVISAYPQWSSPSSEQYPEIQRHSEQPVNEMAAHSESVESLQSYERTLHRLKRALEELEIYEEAADDMELAEINVFRPLFRYRAEFSKQVKNPPQPLG